jgi:hypothetical protein
MSPVKLWASIITQILTYKETNTDSLVSSALHRNKIISITSEMISNLIKDGVVAIGETKLGILCSEVGAHLICSGAVMAIFFHWSTNLLNCADWMLVQPCHSEVHQKTSSKILSQHLIKNDRETILQTRQ